jgi:PIN domain nuclease of toxin-antitoxin system
VNKVMLDASALLAFVNGEPGGDAVPVATGEAMMSAVNFAESISVMISQGMTESTVREQLASLALEVVDFDRSCAEATGFMIQKTRPLGLSLGDRACLAVARDKQIPALTGDRSWSRVDLGVKVNFIR